MPMQPIDKNKAVTFIGFGPSSHEELETVGEVWSMSRCYDAFTPQLMDATTRIFGMHPHEKIMNERSAHDHKPHYWHLDQWGKRGKRIIMLKKHDLITNSETYPLFEMEAAFQVRLWASTPHYMWAMAIHEGYGEIRTIGLDSLDWMHTISREGDCGWAMYALARGITISGEIPFHHRHRKRYGYDFAAGWTDERNEMLWEGFPFEIKWKEGFTRSPVVESDWEKRKLSE